MLLKRRIEVSEKKKLLDLVLDNYHDSNERNDDVTVIGFKIQQYEKSSTTCSFWSKKLHLKRTNC